ncbi:hypothetical protein Asulf_01370 [Archaeoglobus sulfaticallidus PM70-1]|uniref:Uncharacterized protein n=1 Tax=Archaeoglobus sulfaticallidus PM70-1 TaxID=387631 RepID=N0BLE0_9EURY|nr:hypothetical protein Asulf_01370 [Archaeoglobus sulfaticallidus PM70-1]
MNEIHDYNVFFSSLIRINRPNLRKIAKKARHSKAKPVRILSGKAKPSSEARKVARKPRSQD